MKNDDAKNKAYEELLKILKQEGVVVTINENKTYTETEIEPKKVKKGPGRPKGSRKRKEDTTVISVILTLKDKEFVQETARSENMSMSDFISYLIDKERTRQEKLNR